MGDMKDMSAFMTLVNAKLKDEPQTLSKILQYLNSLSEGQKQSMKLEEFNLALVTPNSADQVDEMDEWDLPLKKLIPTLAKVVARMNARQPIESSTPTAVLSVSFNRDSSCFAVGLDSGICSTLTCIRINEGWVC